MEGADENSCVICYESLWASPVGTTVPCGHLFHVECFKNWIDHTQRNTNVKCPMCNGGCTRQTPFVRLFVDLSGLTAGSDDVSDSSDEEDNICEPHDEDDVEGSVQAIRVQTPQEAWQPPCEEDMIITIDDTDNTPKQSRTANQKKSGVLKDKYKRKVRTLQSKVQRLETIRDELLEKEKEYIAMQEKYDISSLLEENKVNHLKLQEVKVMLNRMQSNLDQCQRVATEQKHRAEQAISEMKKFQETHMEALRAAQCTSLTEVRELRREHAAISTESQRTKDALVKRNLEVTKLQQRIKLLESQLGMQPRADDGCEVSDLSRSLNSQKQQQVELLSQFKAQRRCEEGRESAREGRQELQRKMSSKASAMAARICRASEKQIVSSTANSVLQGATVRLQQPNIHVKAKNHATSLKRMNTFVNRNSAPSKRICSTDSQRSNDIRTLFHNNNR